MDGRPGAFLGRTLPLGARLAPGQRLKAVEDVDEVDYYLLEAWLNRSNGIECSPLAHHF